MIDEKRIDSFFRQRGRSCVLASYAIPFNYFTGRDPGECFEAYCQHFNLPYSDRQDAEDRYNQHFHTQYNENRLGYQVIIDLHEHSQVPAFIYARSLFECEFYKKILPDLNNVQDILKKQEALLNITSCNGECHSVTAFYSEQGLSKKDTNKDIIERLIALSDLNNLEDALLLTRKSFPS